MYHRSLIALLGCVPLTAYAQSPVSLYRVGNSLTYQSQSPGIAAMLTTRGFGSVNVGYHVNCGSSLVNSWNNPEQTCDGIPSLPSSFSTALPGNDWTVLSAQPFPGAGSTLGTDAQVIGDLLQLLRQRPANANANSPVYIFATHPTSNTAPTYGEQWLASTPATGDSQPTAASREYYDRLYQKAATVLEQRNLSLIPSGEVLHQLDLRMKSGGFPGINDVYRLYDDAIHLNNAGDYTLGVATLAAITGQDPWGLTAPGNYGATGLTGVQYNALHDTVWTTLCKDPRVKPIWHSANWPYKVHRVGHLRDAVVKTNGTLVEAVNLGSTSNVTINGVAFQGSLTRDGLTQSHSSATVYVDGGISSDFETLMDSFALVGGTTNPASATVTFNNLTAGRRYEVQLFVSDQRTALLQSRRLQFELQGKSPFYIQEGMGFTVTGAFVAAGASETLTIRALQGNADPVMGSPILNGFQVRQVDVASENLAALDQVWTGAGIDGKWSTAGNWLGNTVPDSGQTVIFNNQSTGQLSNTLDAAQLVAGITVTDPPAPLAISGSALTLGSGGLDLSASTQSAAITSPVALGGSQAWTVAAGRTLTIGASTGAAAFIPGTNALTIGGAGDVVLNEAATQQSWALSKAGTGRFTLNSALNLLNNQVTVLDGIFDSRNGRIFSNTTHVSSGGLVLLGGVLELTDWTYGGPGLGWLRANTDAVTLNGGAVRMLASSDYTRGFTLGAKGGTLEAGPAVNWMLGFAAQITINNGANGPLRLTGEGTGTFDKVYPGTAATAKLTKSGSGTWILGQANTSSGPTSIENGTLRVNGSLGTGAVTVEAAGTLSGIGTLNGPTTVAGTIDPGSASPGTLTVNNALTLESGARLKFALGTSSDKMVVSGNLTLDGVIDIADAGGLAGGTYDLIEYTGSLTDQTLELGVTAGSNIYQLDTSVAGKVRLVVTDLYDVWRLEQFQCTDCTESARDQDPDGDGFTNEQEFITGTNPKDSRSVMRITTVARASGGVTITWASVPGRTYQVLFNADLTSPWLDTLPASLVTAGPGQLTLSYEDTTAGAEVTRRFYRVRTKQ